MSEAPHNEVLSVYGVLGAAGAWVGNTRNKEWHIQKTPVQFKAVYILRRIYNRPELNLVGSIVLSGQSGESLVTLGL